MFKIVSKDKCKLCEDAKNMLKTNNIEFEVCKVNKQDMETMCGRRVKGYPQLLLDGKYFGDIFRLEEYINEEYEPLLAKNKNRFTIMDNRYFISWCASCSNII